MQRAFSWNSSNRQWISIALTVSLLGAFLTNTATAAEEVSPAAAAVEAERRYGAIPEICVEAEVEPSASATPSVAASVSASASSDVSESPTATNSASPETTESPSPDLSESVAPSAAPVVESSAEPTVAEEPAPEVDPSLAPRAGMLPGAEESAGEVPAPSADSSVADSSTADVPADEPSSAPISEEASADETPGEASASPSASPSDSVDESPSPSASPEPDELIDPCPLRVSGVGATPGSQEVTINWESADEFSRAFFVTVVGADRVVEVAGSQRSAVISGLRNGMEYSFFVTAVNDSGASEPSQTVSAIPTNGLEGEVAGILVAFEDPNSVGEGQTSVPGEDRVGSVDLTVDGRVTDDVHTVELSEAVTVTEAQQIASELASDPAVAWAEPDQFVSSASEAVVSDLTANDQEYATRQWNLWDTYGLNAGDGSEDFAREYLEATGEGVNVAVIDTGIVGHPDLDEQLVAGFDFVSSPDNLAGQRVTDQGEVAFDADYEDTGRFGAVGWDDNPTDPGDWSQVTPTRPSTWHGTHVAGIIAARTGNTEGVVGIAPRAKIQPIRALSWRGGLISDVAAAITWASGGHVDGVADNAEPSRVINMSFAMNGQCTRALQASINDAIERGSVLVAAAGNADDDVANYAPANCEGVISVGATGRDGKRAPYSNFGAGVDVSAPGGNGTADGGVVSTSNAGTDAAAEPTYTGREGTSVAAAHVAGIAARILSTNPDLRPAEVTTSITGRASVRTFAGDTCDDDPEKTCGTGIVQIATAESTPGVDVAVTVGSDSIADNSTVAVNSVTGIGTSGLLSPGVGNRTLQTTLDPATVYRAGTAEAPEGWTIEYSTNNGSSWSSTEPGTASSVTDVRARKSSVSAGLIEGTSQIYSSETTSSIPSSTFLANAGGDGYNTFFYEDNVYNIFHHNGGATSIMCHVKATSERCPGFSSAFTVSGYATSMRSTGWVDATTGRLYSFGVKSGAVWVVCVDVSTSTPSFCGATQMATGISGGYENIGEGVAHGRRFFGTESSGTNSLLCFDAVTGSPCANSPVDLVGSSTTGGGNMSMTRVAVFDDTLFAVTNTRMYCFDPDTLNPCEGSWPATITPWTSSGMAMNIAPHVNSSQLVDGVCYYSTSTVYSCLNIDGTANSVWKSPMSLGRPAHPHIAMGVESLGRFYYGSGQYQIGCWDYATQASCTNFPKTFPGAVSIVYGVSVDPQNPACIWMNSDRGYIYNFDAYSGENGCSSNPVITLQPSQFAPRYACSTDAGITEWTELRLVSTTGGGSAQSIALTVRRSDGTIVPGWSATPMTVGGSRDMTGLDPSVSGSRPTFNFAFSNVTGTISTAIIALDYKGKGPELCIDATATAASPPVDVEVTGSLTETVGVEETFTQTRQFSIGSTAAIVVQNPPDAPTSLSGSGLNTSATLTWEAPASDGGSSITGYQVSTDSGSTWSDASVVNNSDGSISTTLTGLTAGQTYGMRVAAVNSLGRGTAASISVETQLLDIGTLVDTPVNQGPITMAASSGGRSVTYAASPSSVCTATGTGGRTINLVAEGTCNLVAYQAGDPTATPVILPAETPGSFTVLAAYYAPAEPGVPTDLTLTPMSGQVRLSWTAPTDTGNVDLTDYSVQYKSGSSWIPFIDGVSTSTSALVTGLTNGTTYSFRVAAVNSFGTGAYTSTQTATPATIPGAPTSLASSGTGTSRTLTWTAPGSNGGSAITDYLVEYKPSEDADWTSFSDGVRSTTGATVTGLTNAAAYDYRVTTVNAVGNSTSTSTVNLTATPGASQVALAWSAPASPGGTITDYEMQYRENGTSSWSTFADSVSTSTGGTITGLTNGTTYNFRVATIVDGTTTSSYTSVVSAAPRTSPSAPSDTVATPGNRQVLLSWTAPSDGGAAITDYTIEFKATTSGSWTTFTDGTSSAASATVTGLLNGTSYDFRVTSINTVGSSSVSAVVSATPRTTPGAPGSLTATTGDAQLSLSWSAPASTGGSAITDYQIEVKAASSLTWSVVSHAASTSTAYVLGDLTNGTAYNVRIAAINDAGIGTYGTAISATPRTTPSAPTSLTATFGDEDVDLAWNAPLSTGGAAVTDYHIEYRESGAGAWSTFADGTSTTRSVTITGLTNGTAYQFRVAAENASGIGAYTTPQSATPHTIPGVPRNLVVTGAASSLQVAWDAPTSDGGGTIADYILQVREVGAGSWSTVLDGVSAARSATISGLTVGTPYEVRVAAWNTAGAGPETGAEEGTPTAPPSSSRGGSGGSGSGSSDSTPSSSAPTPTPTSDSRPGESNAPGGAGAQVGNPLPSGALAPSTIGSLRPAVVGALSPAQLQNISPSQAGALRPTQVGALNSEQIGALPPTAVGALRPAVVSSLSGAQLGALSPEAVGALRPNQVGALKPSQVNSLAPQQVAALQPTTISALKPAQVGALGAGAVSSLTPSQLGALRPSQVSALKPNALREITANQLASLSPSAIASLTPAQIRRIPPSAVAGLSVAQASRLTPGAIGNLPGSAFAQLSAENVGVLPRSAFIVLKPAQVAQMSPAAVAAIRSAQMTLMPPAALSQMKPNQVAMISPAALRVMSASQFSAIPANSLKSLQSVQLAALRALTLQAMSSAQFASINPPAFVGISGAQMQSLTPSVVERMSAQQFAALGVGAVRAITASQAQAIQPTTWAGMQPSQIRWLPSQAIAGIDAQDVNRIAPFTLASMTSRQVRVLAPPAFAGLTAEQLQVLPPAFLKAVLPAQLASIEPGVLGALSPQQAQALSANSWTEISPRQFAALQPSVLAVLKPAQAAALPAGAAGGASRWQLPSVAPDAFGALRSDFLQALAPEVFATATVLQLRQLPKGTVQQLPRELLAVLDAQQRQALGLSNEPPQ